MGNEVLDGLLRELSWSPRTLARRLNRDSGAGTVADTAPYHWRDSDRVPRAPLPALVAHLLSCELGRLVTVGELWRGRAMDSPLVMPADAGMRQPWTRAGTLGTLDDWVVTGLLDRRQFLAISGASLTSIPSYLAAPQSPGEFAAAAADSPLIEQIEQAIPLLQRLDDASGGGGHLEYVGAQFRSVALLVRQGGQPRSIETRLLSALAEIGQLAGWMAFDAGLHGPAQRYLFTALRVANECGYSAMAAHIVADLAFQAASRELSSDAVALGESAALIAQHAPAGVRASIQTRLAYGYALAGDMSSFDRAYKSGLEVLADGERSADDPAWMYYLTPSHLDTQAGYALTHTGMLVSENVGQSEGRAMLREGERLLRKGAHDRPFNVQAQRRALFEGAWLATAAAGRGNLEEACALGRTAVARTATVRSARSLEVLARLAARLRRAKRNEYVRDFLPSLESCLARTMQR